MTDLQTRIAARIGRQGPLPFSTYVEQALYDPDDGFYSSGGKAGRRGDFITSVEVGPLFGAVIGRALDRWWNELGRPDPFVVVEAGAGIGTLARTVLEGAPDCLGALTYVLVEQSAGLRARHGDHLAMTQPALALSPRSVDGDGLAVPTDEARGSGPRFVSLAELPALRFEGIVLANELLDNLAFDLVERTPDGWAEVRVGLNPNDSDPNDPDPNSLDPDSLDPDDPDPNDLNPNDPGGFAEVLVPLAGDDHRPELLASLAPDVPVGHRVPIQRRAGEWLAGALHCVERGRVVIIDYGATTASLGSRPWPTWLRTYRGHDRGVHPLDAPGAQDITTDVAVDQLALEAPPAEDVDQAAFLTEHGLDELVDEGRRCWAERAHIGDLTALKARSRIGEAEALVDPAGLGAFRVLTWIVP